MPLNSPITRRRRFTTAIGVSVAVSVFGLAGSAKNADTTAKTPSDAAAAFATESPIKHVIILIGENRGTDHTFGVYKPKGKKETIDNILSKGIVNEDGTPGENFDLAQQYAVAAQPSYYIGAPRHAKTAYGTSTNLMPQPNTNGAPQAPFSTPSGTGPFTFFPPENDIEAVNMSLLLTGATGLPPGVLDTRIPGAGTLPPGPFVLQGPNISDDDYTGDMTHRFYQAWQQQDCAVANATKQNPTGCLNDLFPFVMATYSASNKSAGNEMGFYNAEQEQVSFLKTLADRFTLSDNFHQSVLGGTGANHFMFGTGDAGFWSDGHGNPATPPASMIANPNPKANTVNQYTADNNFSDCSDVEQPGVQPIVDYVESLPYDAEPNCAENHYYMLNNTNPGFLPDGSVVPAVQNALPPSPVPTIGDDLNTKNISWAYFGGSYNDAAILAAEAVAKNPANPDLTAAATSDPAHALGLTYCQICNPFQYATSIMGNPAERAAHIKDTADLITDIANDTLPAVSIGKPDGLLDGHPQSSKIDLFEAYVQNVLDALEAHPDLKQTTAVFITWDEAGGYWDSGFVQVFDFFGDGPRIPLLVLSPYSTGGQISHSYADHVSLDKFIERNWHLRTISDRSRDNLPNPKTQGNDQYVPTNMPALDDLFDSFDFTKAPNNQPYYE
jgi:phospholipase C